MRCGGGHTTSDDACVSFCMYYTVSPYQLIHAPDSFLSAREARCISRPRRCTWWGAGFASSMREDGSSMRGDWSISSLFEGGDGDSLSPTLLLLLSPFVCRSWLLRVSSRGYQYEINTRKRMKIQSVNWSMGYDDTGHGTIQCFCITITSVPAIRNKRRMSCNSNKQFWLKESPFSLIMELYMMIRSMGYDDTKHGI